MYLIFTAGVVLWLTYGLLIASWPIIVGNIVTLVLASSVLAMKLKFG
jgi:MtN3 and saliva related transmembrane protein